MTLREHLSKNISLAGPVIIGQLGHITVTVADSVMVGQVGVVPLAGATFASTVFSILILFGIGFTYALTPLVTSTDPSDQPALLRWLQNSLFTNMGMGAVLILFSLIFSVFMDAFGQPEEVVKAAKPYLLIISASIFPVMIFQTFRQYAEGLSDTLSPMIVSIFSNLLNIGLNYLLIYGKYGFPALGLEGAGYATLISRVVMVAIIIVLVRKRCKGFRWQSHVPTVRRLLQLGVPLGFQYAFEIGAFAVSAIMIGWMGAEALAAHNITMSLSAITYMVSMGLASAATIRAGNQLRLKDRRNLRVAGFSGFLTVVVIMMFCGLLFILFRDQLPALYISDPAVKSMASSLLLIVAAYQISDGLQAVGLGLLRGIKDVNVPTLVTFVAYWLTAIPSGYVLGFVFDMGVEGVWYGLCIGLTLAAILHIWRFNRLTNRLLFENEKHD